MFSLTLFGSEVQVSSLSFLPASRWWLGASRLPGFVSLGRRSAGLEILSYFRLLPRSHCVRPPPTGSGPVLRQGLAVWALYGGTRCWLHVLLIYGCCVVSVRCSLPVWAPIPLVLHVGWRFWPPVHPHVFGERDRTCLVSPVPLPPFWGCVSVVLGPVRCIPRSMCRYLILSPIS